ncbi:MAG: hypothetical protein ABIJ72_00420 [bacterium]
MILNVIEWFIWGIVALFAVSYLLNNNSDGGVRYMMRIQSLVLIIGLILTFSYISKFHLIWIAVVAFVAPMIVMQLRMGRGMKQFEKQIKEAKDK